MLPFVSCYDVAYGIYKTAGHISIASEYVCDVYANTLENFRQIQRNTKKLFPCNRYICEVTLFDVVEFQ